MRALSIGAGLVAALALTGCDPHSVSIRFDPEAGDTYRLRSEIDTEVVRTVGDETSVERSRSRLDATERVLAVDGESIEVSVSVERDGGAPRSYDVRFDPSGRLSTIDLVEGVPAEALGLDLATDLPSDVSSPPRGPVEPRTTWTIDRDIGGGDGRTTRVTGSGRVDEFGVVDGVDVVTVDVALVVPLHSVRTTPDGLVTVRGQQSVVSRTTYDIADGTARRDRTVIEGSVDVVVEPPAGIAASPVPGRIEFSIETETRRVKDG